MAFFDAHTHLPDEAGDAEAEAIVCENLAAGVDMLLAGTDTEDAPRYVALARRHPGRLFVTCGVHPECCGRIEAAEGADFVEKMITSCPEIVSVGEIGLDLHSSDVPLEKQQAVLAAMLEVAARHGKPVTIHCRDAFRHCFPMVRDLLPAGHPVHVHSFTDSPAEMEQWLTLNSVFSYNGMVTFKKAENIRETLAMVPMERLLTETDAPYLTPVPFRGKPNASKYIPLIAAKIAELRGGTAEEIGALTAGNARRFFGIEG